ncbi:MAG: endonuclease/exonuclease/phosphatase family protein [Candidatus Methylacidiphilales bacterium]|nr:endonuclease/exonuclease/phosphatase family protein [Candidatus Methylacidiphilales bacterium]
MRRIGGFTLLALVAVLTLASPSCSFGNPKPADHYPLRVATWNVQWFPGKSPRNDPAAEDAHIASVATVLQRLNADILLFQEVKAWAPLERVVSGLPRIRIHVLSRFPNPIGGGVGPQQLAIASRLPAWSAWSEPWKQSWANAPRGFAFAALDDGSGTPILVYNVHLKSNLGDPVANTSKREDASAQLLAHMAEMKRAYGSEKVIVGGDFNTDMEGVGLAGENTLRAMAESGLFWTFEGLPLTNRVTLPAKGRYPDACFDHILTKGFGRPVAQVTPTPEASDHHPVSIVITPTP